MPAAPIYPTHSQVRSNYSCEQERILKDSDDDERWDFYDELMYKVWNGLEAEAGV